ncbi:hypothetical protein MLP_52660 [Microlunatus phosphovorus NM-1]|uniref:VUT family protein n=1 Tax=Microlunatus phosphovorus (strain ATCC 700054 / DSM 10555 / JCM 9379 / NBRC 101784 / NCIMB 13414 / VKM Ac-1990 / NM-1) TaxID=1032480 RepID=F5XIP2_MICPN|nr:VUT family protein [Microlunatus phosphovorus]BAK38280.1 hypothetical protein MLP_52660 [Microlunatus phosphovorus NM-1]
MAWIATFLACIVASNWAITHLGVDHGPDAPRTIPVGFGLSAPSGVVFAGALFALRDVIHERLGSAAVLVIIIVSAPVTMIAASPGLAVASVVTFVVAETVDLLVYRRIRASGYATAAIASNLASSLIDSALFLGLAFGAAQALHGTLGLTLGKVGSSTITVVIMLVIVRRVRHPSDPVGTAPICLSEPWWR